MKIAFIASVIAFVSQCQGTVDSGECSTPALHPTDLCRELRTAWVFNNDTGKCELSAVCPITGPNKYQQKVDCEIMCEGPCSAPAYHAQFACVAVEYTWRYNGHSCEHVTACPSKGANRFHDKQSCQVACDGGTRSDKCSAAPILPNFRCIPQRAWVYSISGVCEETYVCPLNGPNKYPDIESCVGNCVPKDCIYPEFESECYSGDMWRFDASTGKCNKEGVCGSIGQNKFETQALCIETCTLRNSVGVGNEGVCSAPPTRATCLPDVNDKAWVYSPDSGKCEYMHVCPFPSLGSLPNKYLSKTDCEVRCEGSCSAPAYHPAYSCPQFDQTFAWRLSNVSGICEYSTVCPPTGSNRYTTEAKCKAACVNSGEYSIPNAGSKDLCLDGAFPTESCSIASTVSGGAISFMMTLISMLEYKNW